MKAILTCALAAFLVACPPVAVQPAPDGGDSGDDLFDAASPCSKACANLETLGCDEGKKANCADVCSRAMSEKLTDLHPACLSSAHTKADARACGSVRCK